MLIISIPKKFKRKIVKTLFIESNLLVITHQDFLEEYCQELYFYITDKSLLIIESYFNSRKTTPVKS